MSIARETSRLVGLDLVGEIAAKTLAGIGATEGLKGCDPTLRPQPIDLEPPFGSLDVPPESIPGNRQHLAETNKPRLIDKPVILKVWCPRDAKLDWQQHNDLLKELTVSNHPIAFEIAGNSLGVWIQLAVDQQDLAAARTAVLAEFPRVQLEELKEDPITSWLTNRNLHLDLEDFYPEPPYYRTMTVHETIGGSPLDPVYVALRHLPPTEFAIYRVLAAPTNPRHDWHQRINNLTDAEYRGSNADFYNPAIPHAYHQVPSLYLPMVSEREEKKAHPDRPFYAASVMIVALSPDARRPAAILKTLRTALRNFLYGAKPLCYLSRKDFLRCLSLEAAIRDVLKGRVVHRPGMILNTLELSMLVHFPPWNVLEDENDILHRIKGFEVPASLQTGRLLVGYNHYLNRCTPVFIPGNLTNEHIYIIGKPGVGKSELLKNLILQEIAQGRGVALIEPHGDLTESVMNRIPRERVPDVVFLDFLDDQWVACLNPFDISPQEDHGRMADEITSAFKDGVDSWGPRMENILRQACYVLLQRPGSTLEDISLLLSPANEGQRLRERILEGVTNTDALRFWRNSFPKYKAEAIDPVTNKLSKLLLNEKIAAVFRQRQGRIVWRAIMDTGKVFVARLSGLGPANTNFLGALIIGGLKEAACARSDIPPSKRRGFSIYIDEFHRFPTGSIEDLLVECRKFGVSIRLAHQETGQLDYSTRRAVGTADTVIAFCVDTDDARHLIKEFRKEIEEEDLLSLRVGEAYARINNEIVDVTTQKPTPEPQTGVIQQIIEHSHRNYYVKRSENCAAESAVPDFKRGPRIFETF